MNQTEEVKKIIRSLLVSSPVKVTVSSLNRDYKTLEGFYIPYMELGYNSLIHFLYSIPDVLRVNGTSVHAEVSLVVSEKIAHVNDMVMKQKRPSKGRNSLLARKSIVPPSSAENHITHQEKRNSVPAGNNINIPSQSNHQVILQEERSANFASPVTQLRNSVTCLSPFPRPLLSPPDRVPSLYKHNPEDILKKYELKAKKEITEHTVLEIQSKIAKLKLRKLLKKENNTPHTENSNLTFEINQRNDKEGLINVKKAESRKVPLDIVNNLQKLISKYPYGILCTDLLLEYKKKYDEDLNFQAYGFSGLINLCLTLENIFHCRRESDYDFKIYDKSKPLPQFPVDGEPPENHLIKRDCLDPFSIEASRSEDWNKFCDIIPDGILKLGEKIENNVHESFNVGESIQIVVSEIYNSSKFWIYKDDGVLDSMMNSMQIFYGDSKPAFIIPEFLLEQGLYCVVFTLSEFQRGLIIDLLPNIGGHVKVYLIDYGTIVDLRREKILFLSKEFSSLPAQAVIATLDNVEPIEESWNERSNVKFKEFVTNKHILMKISGKDRHIIKVFIADTKFPCNFLNDVLVEEGFAKYSSKENLKGLTNCIQKIPDKIRAKEKLVQRTRAMKRISSVHDRS